MGLIEPWKAYGDEIILQRPEGASRAGICVCSFPACLQHDEFEKLLHPHEQAYFRSMKFEKRKNSYLMGRYAAKKAFSALTGEKDFRSILIHQGIFNQPIATYAHAQNMQVSISHCDEFGAALAFPEAHPLGIDIEKIDSGRRAVLESQLTAAEKKLMCVSSHSHDTMLALLWTVKEAMSKIIKTGLTAPLHIFSINKTEMNADVAVSYFENFGQYKGISFVTHHSVCSIVCPKKTEMNVDAAAVKRVLDFTQGNMEKRSMAQERIISAPDRRPALF